MSYAVALASGLRPPPLRSLAEWSDAERILPASAAVPGQWETSRAPYLREIMDRLSMEDPCQRVVFMKGSQIGASEVMNNWIAMTIARNPCEFLMVQPTEATAIKYSKKRIATMISSMECLRSRVDTRARDSSNTILEKQFPGGSLTIVGANAPSGLASLTIKNLAMDEVDRFPREAGNEGDPVALAEVRTSVFTHSRKIYKVSTPTVAGESRIEADFVKTGQRYFHVPCPHCEERQVLRWESVQWPKGRPGDAVYICEHCGAEIEEWQKGGMLAGGEWVADRPELEDGMTYGYHLSALYSPWFRWGDIAREFVQAQGDPVQLKVVINTRFGQTWAESSDSLSDDPLMDRREDFGPAAFDNGIGPEVPKGVVWLTAVVDTQDDRLEAKVVGWGLGEEAWVIDHQVFHGDPAARSGVSPEGVWADLDIYLQREWRHELGVSLTVTACCVDSGGHHASPVREFAKYRAKRRVWAVIGSKTADDPIWPKAAGKTQIGKFYYIGVGEAKWKAYRRLRIETPGRGYVHFSTERDPEYFKQLTAERRRRKKSGAYEWKKIRERNEAWDLLVYSYAALHGLYALGKQLSVAKARLEAWAQQQASGQKPQPKTATPWAPDEMKTKTGRTKRSGYLKSRRSHWRK